MIMKKNIYSLLVPFLLMIFVALTFFCMMPVNVHTGSQPLSEFSTQRAMEHITVLSKKPHYVGTKAHEEAALYLVSQLNELGLETQIQEGYTLTEWGNLAKSKNIIAKLPGNGGKKALLLLSHYDSAPHSKSHGAADDASGVATILEGLRVFIHNKNIHKNDIIIVFSDAEELGLNGAALFVGRHPWAKETGLALNFEARGTSGPSFMLMEVNKGNAAMVEGFSEAGVSFPVSNSLMYSIYKMLPNDTDLTVFRESGNIQGFNFAFIDDHFNYHTAQDDIRHLNRETVAHQGTYILPLLTYFSNADLTHLESTDEDVYFNIPFGFIHYPFSWNFPLLIIAYILFLGFVFVGVGKRLMDFPEIGKGFAPLFGSLLASALLAYFGWQLLLIVYPDYSSIQQGFTYNGHDYIAAFVLLTLSLVFLFYEKWSARTRTMNHFVAPLFLGLVLNTAIMFFLPGAGFLIIPVFAGLTMFGYFIITQKINRLLNVFLALPAIVILAPFIQMFPVGLGLRIMGASALLTVIIFTWILPVTGLFTKKGYWSAVFFIAAAGFFIKAHLNSGFSDGKAKPDSLDYVYYPETGKSFWLTTDTETDEWTGKYFNAKSKPATEHNRLSLFSKYNGKFTLQANADNINLPRPHIAFNRDTVSGNRRYLDITITPQRKVNRYDIFTNPNVVVYQMNANGADLKTQKKIGPDRRLLSYYVTDNAPLQLKLVLSKNTDPGLELIESSFDLLENTALMVAERPKDKMPKPFILNDAVMLIEKIKPSLTRLYVDSPPAIVRDTITGE